MTTKIEELTPEEIKLFASVVRKWIDKLAREALGIYRIPTCSVCGRGVKVWNDAPTSHEPHWRVEPCKYCFSRGA